MVEEIELKLALTPKAMEALRRSRLWRSLGAGRMRRQRLVSIYFDTPDRLLAKSGCALRIRHDGQRRIQTLKIPSAGGGELHRYGEIETVLEGDRPDLSVVGNSLPRLLPLGRLRGRLLPVFHTEFERRTMLVTMKGARIEVAFDRGAIVAERKRAALCEIELELKTGNRARLYELALALSKLAALTVERRTKAARGYTLADGGKAPVPRRAEAIALDRAAQAGAAFVAVARSCLDQMRANEACLGPGADAEGVHQMRVAVRRLRALVACYRDWLAPDVHAYLSAKLRRFQQALGPAREWQVFIAGTLAPLAEHLPNNAPLTAMRHAAQALREGAALTAGALPGERTYTEFVLTLALWLETDGWRAPRAAAEMARPASVVAAAILLRRYKRLRKFGGKDANTLSEMDLHRLRLLGKKLRYAVEFFSALYPRRPVRRFMDTLSDIQDSLGALNDAVVNRSLLARIDHSLATDTARAAHARGLVQGWEAARIREDRQAFAEVWRRFRRLAPYW